MSIALTLALVGIFTGYAESVAAGQMVLVYGFNSDRLKAIFENKSAITNWMTAFLSLASFTTITISAAIGESWFYWPYLTVSLIFGMCTGKIGPYDQVKKGDNGEIIRLGTDVTLPYLGQYFTLIASVLFAFGHVFAQTDDSALILASIGAGCSFISDGIVTSSVIFERKLNSPGKKSSSPVPLSLCSLCYVASAVGFSLTESAGIIATVTWVFQCINFLKTSANNKTHLRILKLLLVLAVAGLAVTSVSIGGKHGLFDTTSVDLGVAALSIVFIQNTIQVVDLF